jgi:hypothetical protein
MYMSHSSLTWQAVRYVYVTLVTHMAGGALCICHTHHSHGRRCVTYMSHMSLTWHRWDAAAAHPLPTALRMCHTRHAHGRRSVTDISHPSLTCHRRQAVRDVYVTPVTHTAPIVGGALQICHTRHSHGTDSRRCATYMSNPSLTWHRWQAVRYVYVTPVNHPPRLPHGGGRVAHVDGSRIEGIHSLRRTSAPHRTPIGGHLVGIFSVFDQ